MARAQSEVSSRNLSMACRQNEFGMYSTMLQGTDLEVLIVYTASRLADRPSQQSYLARREQKFRSEQVKSASCAVIRATKHHSFFTVPDMSLKNTSAAIVRYLEARFAELGSEGNLISVTIDSNAPWWIADRQHPYSKAAEEAVLQECGVSRVLNPQTLRN